MFINRQDLSHVTPPSPSRLRRLGGRDPRVFGRGPDGHAGGREAMRSAQPMMEKAQQQGRETLRQGEGPPQAGLNGTDGQRWIFFRSKTPRPDESDWKSYKAPH